MTDHERGIEAAISDPAEYRRIHDIAAAAYEAAVPVDYRYSALALRKAVDAAITAYLAITKPGKPESGVLAVKVKPLEWAITRNDWKANSSVGQYAVGIVGLRPICLLRHIKNGDIEDTVISSSGSTEEAKAAAQADYEQRTMAALTTPPQPVEAHKKLELWFFRDMFESNRLALFSLFGFKAEHVDTMAKQQKSFRHILRNEGAK